MANTSALRLRILVGTLVMLAAVTAAGSAVAQASASVGSARGSVLDCGAAPGRGWESPQVAVSGGSERDHEFSCVAARRAVAFFVGHGLTPDTRLKIEFTEAVFLDLSSCGHVALLDPSFSGGCIATAAQAERVAGIFRQGSRTVLMTTEASSWLDSYTYFGLPVSEEMFTSMLTHEIAHALSKSLYAPHLRTANVDIRVQEEYVAYVAQLSTMSSDLRTAVLARFPASAHRFSDETDINALSLGLNPEAFGVKSYRHFKDEGGGPVFLRRLYGGEYRPPVQYLY